MSSPHTVCILDYDVATVTLQEAVTWCLEATQDPRPQLLVTTNPEIIIQAEANAQLKQVLQHAALTVADGAGVVWAAKQFGHKLPERVPGVELTTKVLEQGGSDLRVYFLGAKPGIAQKAADEAQRRFATVVAGVQHGYFNPGDVPQVIEAISKSNPHLLLAGLGEGQELFLDQHKDSLNVPLMIGVGGTLDVLSGEVKRTPAWTRTLGLEWAWRVGFDPKRWHRFPRLLAFMRLVMTHKRKPLS